MIIFAIILFILSFLVVASMFLFKLSVLSEGSRIPVRMTGQNTHLSSLRLYFKKKISIVAGKLWHFILEAKDLKPVATKTFETGAKKLKKVFRIRIRTQDNEPHWLPEAQELTVQSQVNHNPEDIYLEAIKKNPQDMKAFEALGRLYLQNKNYADAAEAYEYLTQLDRNRDIYWSNLGLSYYGLKQFPKAIAGYQKALELNNKVPTRWINLSLCFEALEDYTKAIKALTQALALDKLNVNYMMMLAEIYLQIPNNIRAEEVLEQILVIEPTNRLAREKLMRLKI